MKKQLTSIKKILSNNPIYAYLASLFGLVAIIGGGIGLFSEKTEQPFSFFGSGIGPGEFGLLDQILFFLLSLTSF